MATDRAPFPEAERRGASRREEATSRGCCEKEEQGAQKAWATGQGQSKLLNQAWNDNPCREQGSQVNAAFHRQPPSVNHH